MSTRTLFAQFALSDAFRNEVKRDCLTQQPHYSIHILLYAQTKFSLIHSTKVENNASRAHTRFRVVDATMSGNNASLET